MLTSEQVVEYLIMIDLQRKGAENKLNAEGLSALFDLQSNKELKDVRIVDVLDYIHAQEEALAEKNKEIKRQIAVNKEMDNIIGEKDEEIEKLKGKPTIKTECDLEQQLAIYKRALELACREIIYDCGSWRLTIEDEMQGYLDQAKKEFKRRKNWRKKNNEVQN